MNRGELVAAAALSAWIIVVPLPAGGVLPGGLLLATAGGLLSGALALFATRSASALRSAAPVLVAVTLLALLGLVQSLPLPSELLRIVSPTSLELYHEAERSLAAASIRSTPAPTISLAPRQTRAATLLIAGAAGAFIAALLLGSRRPARRLLYGAIIASALVQLLIALAEGTTHGRVSGSFVNPNHLAAHLQIAAAAAFGLLWMALVGSSSDSARRADDPASRLEQKALPILSRALLWGTLAGGIALTRSRGGIAAAAIATILLLIAALHRGRRRLSRRRLATMSAIALSIALGMAFAATRGAALDRFLESDPREATTDSRVRAWTTSIEAWREFPWTGGGLGAFREAFRRHQPEGLPGLWEFAHSDPLQILVTGGVAGLTLAFIVWLAAFGTLARLWRRQRHREEGAMALGAMLALVSLGLHGFVEFNLSIPAILMTLATFTGLGVAAGRFET